jgi:hypothetical protein
MYLPNDHPLLKHNFPIDGALVGVRSHNSRNCGEQLGRVNRLMFKHLVY